MKYYRLTIDDNLIDSWELSQLMGGDTEEDDGWKYSYPGKLSSVPVDLYVNISKKGYEIDYNLVYPNVPIISENMMRILPEEEIQIIPVDLIGSRNRYFILKMLFVIDCLDESRSKFKKWESGSKVRPDLVGQYYSIDKYVLDKQRIGSSKIFRLGNYDGVIIINSELKEQFERLNLTGMKYFDIEDE